MASIIARSARLPRYVPIPYQMGLMDARMIIGIYDPHMPKDLVGRMSTGIANGDRYETYALVITG